MAIKTVPRAGSQNARILNALRSGRWVTVSEIHRRAGFSRLNSRISELRRYGYTIEHRHVPRGLRATLEHSYRWTNIPPAVTPETPEFNIPGDTVAPRMPEERFRIYRARNDQLELVATAPTPESVGVALVQLGSEGEFDGGYCVGLLDALPDDPTHPDPHERRPGRWLLNPFDPTTY